jgi:hypothetical protein
MLYARLEEFPRRAGGGPTGDGNQASVYDIMEVFHRPRVQQTAYRGEETGGRDVLGSACTSLCGTEFSDFPGSPHRPLAWRA